MLQRLFVPKLEIADVKFVGQGNGPIDKLAGDGWGTADNATVIHIGQADQEATEKQTFDQSERQDRNHLSFQNSFEHNGLLAKSATQDLRPGWVLAQWESAGNLAGGKVGPSRFSLGEVPAMLDPDFRRPGRRQGRHGVWSPCCREEAI
jgi:hypothetical protein